MILWQGGGTQGLSQIGRNTGFEVEGQRRAACHRVAALPTVNFHPLHSLGPVRQVLGVRMRGQPV
jgi:hypothetical protein